jgi:hypothetical protein
MPGAIYCRAFLLEADTGNVVKTISIIDSDTGTTHNFVGGPGVNQIQHNGQTQIEYAFVAPFVAHLFRDEPQDQVQWRRFGLTPVGDPWPELTTEVSEWLKVNDGMAAFLQGLVVPVEAAGAIPNFSINYDNAQNVALTSPVTPIGNQKTPIPYALETPVVCHIAQLVPSEKCRIWIPEIRWIFEATPELAATWTTQATSHGLKGYHSIYRIEFVYASTAAVALTIVAFDGTSPTTFTLPGTGGTKTKVLLTPTFNKGQLYSYSATSASAFQVFGGECTVWVGEWGRSTLALPWRGLGGAFTDDARL